MQDLLKRDQLFGDWGGARGKMGTEGTKLDVSFTQFFQWVPNRDTPLLQDPTGAVTTKYMYGGKFDIIDTSDLSKLAWKGLSMNAHVEIRFGDVPLLAGGTLIPDEHGAAVSRARRHQGAVERVELHAGHEPARRGVGGALQHARPVPAREGSGGSTCSTCTSGRIRVASAKTSS